jgi:hypothetical protein
MSHLISIDLLPNIGTVLDLGTTPCTWQRSSEDQRDEGVLQFEDAPYEFYDYVEQVLGYGGYDDNSIDKKFCTEFFTILNQEIASKGGFSNEDMQFMLIMPKFFNLTFNINIFTDNE